jgi:hypothetical protein
MPPRLVAAQTKPVGDENRLAREGYTGDRPGIECCVALRSLVRLAETVLRATAIQPRRCSRLNDISEEDDGQRESG